MKTKQNTLTTCLIVGTIGICISSNTLNEFEFILILGFSYFILPAFLIEDRYSYSVSEVFEFFQFPFTVITVTAIFGIAAIDPLLECGIILAGMMAYLLGPTISLQDGFAVPPPPKHIGAELSEAFIDRSKLQNHGEPA